MNIFLWRRETPLHLRCAKKRIANILAAGGPIKRWHRLMKDPYNNAKNG